MLRPNDADCYSGAQVTGARFRSCVNLTLCHEVHEELTGVLIRGIPVWLDAADHFVAHMGAPKTPLKVLCD